jgi:VIT1/CCC1 family predicted Fe2+/Mn2+ transporter
MNKEKDFWKKRLREWTALDPPDRISEVLFGLIMVLTFIGTISVSTAGEQDVRQLLWAALGCNLAWGLVDAIMNIMTVFLDHKHGMMQIKQIGRAKDPTTSREIIRDNISPLISELMDNEEIDRLGEKLKKLPTPDMKYPLTVKDFIIAVQIFLLVFLSTFPVAAPFIILDEVAVALRVSNAVALVLLFAGGYSLAIYAGLKPIIMALIYAAIGIFLVSLTMTLGG